VLDVARQMAADANYCMATGLHDTSPLPSDNTFTSPSGCLAVNLCFTALNICLTCAHCIDTVGWVAGRASYHV